MHDCRAMLKLWHSIDRECAISDGSGGSLTLLFLNSGGKRAIKAPAPLREET
jgi:hypothetical protein